MFRPTEEAVIAIQEAESLALAILFSKGRNDLDFWLLFYDGLSFTEIAGRLGVSPQRVSCFAGEAFGRLRLYYI